MNPHWFSIASTLTWLSKCCRTRHSVSPKILYLDETTDTRTGPFFLFLFPVFFFFQGNKLEDPSILLSSAYLVLVSLFCASSPIHYKLVANPRFLPGFSKWYSRLYRNQGSLLFGPGAVDWGEQIVLITGGACQLQFTLHLLSEI